MVKFNAGDFHEGLRGTIEYRFSTELAMLFLKKLKVADV